MASESDTEEFYDAPEDVHLGDGYSVGSPGKVGLSSFKEAENTENKAGNESPVQELRQDISKKIIESIVEERQKVLQLEDDSLDSKEKGLSDQATADPSVAETDLNNIPGLLAIEHELQDHEKADSQNVSEGSDLETQKCFTSDDTCEKTVAETVHLNEVSSAEQLDVSELETEILSKEAMEVKESDVLDPASSDSLSTKDFAAAEEVAPAKPPRHLTPEPDIVASTKKAVPARPPPPTNFPPPRPPPSVAAAGEIGAVVAGTPAASSPGLRRATASSLALFIHLAPGTPATVPDPLQPPQAVALQVIPLAQQLRVVPCP